MAILQMKMGALFSENATSATATAISRTIHAEEPRVEVMLVILFVSLLAVSLPSLSKQIPSLRIPGIIFFIGKHFGTGVILATAFIHLLDDAFRSLQDGRVAERYGRLPGKWTGGIILAALLSIFLVEYISTSYVEQLQEKPSAPPTPVASVPSSRPASLHSKPTRKACEIQPASKTASLPAETTPLLACSSVDPTSKFPPQRPARCTPVPVLIPSSQAHNHHHHHPSIGPALGLSIEVLTNSPRVCRLILAHGHNCGAAHETCAYEDLEGLACRGDNHNENADHHHGHSHQHDHDHEHDHRPMVGRRRQVVGLLVLQLGIMIHSFVIGLTLSVTYGSDFTSLTTAIIFHQLFEGLSLGIRIAALPPSKQNTHQGPGYLGHDDVDTDLESQSSDDHQEITAQVTPWRGRTLSSTSTLPHSYNSGSTRKARSRSKSESPPRVSSASGRRRRMRSGNLISLERLKGIQWLKPTLTFLFGVTTPLGMGLGMVMWEGRSRQGDEEASMLLIQGLMSAISAGMLIYAATVEMIAGDFVFGDVEGGSHHHHHHHDDGHGPGHEHGSAHGKHGQDQRAVGNDDSEEARLSSEARARGEGHDSGGDQTSHTNSKASVPKRVLAVLSLLAGAGMMVLVGLGE